MANEERDNPGLGSMDGQISSKEKRLGKERKWSPDGTRHQADCLEQKQEHTRWALKCGNVKEVTNKERLIAR